MTAHAITGASASTGRIPKPPTESELKRQELMAVVTRARAGIDDPDKPSTFLHSGLGVLAGIGLGIGAIALISKFGGSASRHDPYTYGGVAGALGEAMMGMVLGVAGLGLAGMAGGHVGGLVGDRMNAGVISANVDRARADLAKAERALERAGGPLADARLAEVRAYAKAFPEGS